MKTYNNISEAARHGNLFFANKGKIVALMAADEATKTDLELRGFVQLSYTEAMEQIEPPKFHHYRLFRKS